MPTLTPKPLTDAEREQWLDDIEKQKRDGLITLAEMYDMREQILCMPAKE